MTLFSGENPKFPVPIVDTTSAMTFGNVLRWVATFMHHPEDAPSKVFVYWDINKVILFQNHDNKKYSLKNYDLGTGRVKIYG